MGMNLTRLVPQFKGERFIFLTCERNILAFLDLAKVADIVCPIITCKAVDFQQFKENPYEKSGAFDDLSLQMISAFRAQGVTKIVPIIQDIGLITNPSKQNEVRKLYKRFLESEFPESRAVSIEEPSDITKLLLEFQRITIEPVYHQIHRGYMLAEGLEFKTVNGEEVVEIWGVTRGQGFSNLEHVHVTGYGDLEVLGIASSFEKKNLVCEERIAELEHEVVDTEAAMIDEMMVGVKGTKSIKVTTKRDAYANAYFYQENDGSENFSLFPSETSGISKEQEDNIMDEVSGKNIFSKQLDQ